MRRGCFTLSLLMVGITACVGAETARGRPDVILITVDTLRADHVGCFGGKVPTPAWDRLCKDGIRFGAAFAPSPITNSSHASIFTGKTPSHHGVTSFGMPLSSQHPTLAETLKQQGYQTAGFIAAVILDSRQLARGFDRGFITYENLPESSPRASRYPRLERRAEDVVQRATAWLKRNPRGPRFLWVHLFDPHDPYDPPPPFRAKYQHDLYSGEIAYADSALHSLLRVLDRYGWYEDALIIAVGDHGEGLGEHGEETHGIFLYDSTLHVPLIVKLPGRLHAGVTVAEPVRTVDILPTVAQVLAIDLPSGLDGTPLLPLNQNRVAAKTLLAQTDYPLTFGWAPLRAVRSRDYKFIEAPRPELYDLGTDPAEQKNVYEPWSAPVQEARSLLNGSRADTPGSAPAVPATTIAELRALGYLGTNPGSSNVPEPSRLPDPKDRIAVQNLLHRAMLHVEDGALSAAREELEKALSLEPGSPTALLQLGRVEYDAGRWERATQYLARAREARPEDAEAAWLHGRSLERLGELEPAAQALEASLRLSPSQFEARHLLGRVYLALKRYDAAQDQLEAAVLLDPRSPAAHVDLARTLIALRKTRQAREQVAAALSLDPNNREAQRLLVEITARE